MPRRTIYIRDKKLYLWAEGEIESGKYRNFSHIAEEGLRALRVKKEGLKF